MKNKKIPNPRDSRIYKEAIIRGIISGDYEGKYWYEIVTLVIGIGLLLGLLIKKG